MVGHREPTMENGWIKRADHGKWLGIEGTNHATTEFEPTMDKGWS
jgi:hypothetical protein